MSLWYPLSMHYSFLLVDLPLPFYPTSMSCDLNSDPLLERRSSGRLPGWRQPPLRGTGL